MNRCQTSPDRRQSPAQPARRRHALLAVGATALLALLPTLAPAQVATDQIQRQFPEHARRGVLRVVAPPEILLDGKADRLSPGARIRGSDNQIVMPHQLVGQDLRVNYAREGMGLVHQVWILTPAELAQQRAGNNGDGVQRNFRFASETQSN